MLIGDVVAEAISMKYPSDLREYGEGKVSRYQAIAFGGEQTGVSMIGYWTIKAKATKGRYTLEGFPVKIDTLAGSTLGTRPGKRSSRQGSQPGHARGLLDIERWRSVNGAVTGLVVPQGRRETALCVFRAPFVCRCK
jgi:hypothetical protein